MNLIALLLTHEELIQFYGADYLEANYPGTLNFILKEQSRKVLRQVVEGLQVKKNSLPPRFTKVLDEVIRDIEEALK